MAMFPALMNDTMFSDLFDDPFFEGWRSADNSAAMTPTNMMSTDVRENDKGYAVAIKTPAQGKDWNEYLLWQGCEERRRENRER